MDCQFKGAFTVVERARIERAVRRFERARRIVSPAMPTWAFMNFATLSQGASYWGVHPDDRVIVKADTAKGLAMAVDAVRERVFRDRRRGVRRETRPVRHDSPELATARHRAAAA